MATWAIKTESPDSEFRKALDQVAALNGPVVDIESMITDLDLGRGAFGAVEEDNRRAIVGRIREGVRAYFKSIHDSRREAPLYAAFANAIVKGDVVVTFNYDTALENELVQRSKFCVRDGYGFTVNWDEPDSDVLVLKPHGSINWNGLLFGGNQGFGGFTTVLGPQPFIDNADRDLFNYPDRALDKSFPGGGVRGSAVTLVLPTYEKRFSVRTSVGNEWASFYESLWSKAAESLQLSDRIVIIGYSLPIADRLSRAVLLWSANKRAEVLICSASSNSYIRTEFENHGFWRVLEMGTFEKFLGITSERVAT